MKLFLEVDSNVILQEDTSIEGHVRAASAEHLDLGPLHLENKPPSDEGSNDFPIYDGKSIQILSKSLYDFWYCLK